MKNPEINEAFANVPMIWEKELGVDPAKVNPNGGAVAHGHPLGATGAILMTKLLNGLCFNFKNFFSVVNMILQNGEWLIYY